MIGYIYYITSKLKKMHYIGSTIDIETRWKTHKKELRLNQSGNHRLQNHYNKYGSEDLIYTIEFIGQFKDRIALYDLETEIIGIYWPNCFNEKKTGANPPSQKGRIGYWRGKKRSQEEIQKSVDHRPIVIHPWTGKTWDDLYTPEEINHLKSNLRQHHAGGPRIGHEVTEETRKKQSESHIGKSNGPMPEETKQLLSKIHTGLTHTDEAKQHMREAWLIRKQKKEQENQIVLEYLASIGIPHRK